MTLRRSLEPLLKELKFLLTHPDVSDGEFRLSSAVRNLWGLTKELSRDAAKTRQMLEIGSMLRTSNVRGRQVEEEHFMENLSFLAHSCNAVLREAEFARSPASPTADEAPPELEHPLGVLRVLREFALSCFEFKRPHDSFGGRRRALAFEILGKVGLVVDLPEVVHTALKALKKAQSVESRQAAEFLRVYFAERDPPPNDELIDELLSLAERTNSRSTAFAALNTLVEIGTISEFEAVDRINDWKSKRR